MFPKLTTGSSQQSESTAVRHNVARLRSKKTFAEGEEVIENDNKSKLSTAGKILDLLGNNTYLADCGKGPQHVSGDLLSKVSEAADREVGRSNEVQQIEDDNFVDRDLFQVDDDNISIASESSIGSDIVAAPDNLNVNVNIPRRGRRRLDHLGPANLQ